MTGTPGRIWFGFVLVAMLVLTTVASLDRGVFVALDELWPDPWFRATLADAYFAFLTVWLWIASRERTVAAKAAWLVAVLCLGSIAIAIYMLIRVRPSSGDGMAAVRGLRP
ncbi:MAG: DUF1475 domain-containing protein [Acidobacteria bacterium]|nr:MAG: DUF1475 domain-containing protein [Acidobacteriota bacterium]